jgi:hypothetical protein
MASQKHGWTPWQRKAAHLIVARKQRDRKGAGTRQALQRHAPSELVAPTFFTKVNYWHFCSSFYLFIYQITTECLLYTKIYPKFLRSSGEQNAWRSLSLCSLNSNMLNMVTFRREDLKQGSEFVWEQWSVQCPLMGVSRVFCHLKSYSLPFGFIISNSSE